MANTNKRIRLKELRKDYNLTQEEIANKAGVSQAFLSAIEKGKRGPSQKLKDVLCKDFCVDNIQEYEYEVERISKNSVYENNGQHNEGKVLRPVFQGCATNQDTKDTTSSVEVLTKVIADYLNRIQNLTQENESLRQEMERLIEENEKLSKKIQRLN